MPPGRERRITFRLYEEQYSVIARNADLMHLTISEYVREVAVEGHLNYVVKCFIPMDEVTALQNEISRIGNNLNQIAHDLNTGGTRSRQTINEINACLSKLDETRKKLNQLGERTDGGFKAYR